MAIKEFFTHRDDMITKLRTEQIQICSPEELERVLAPLRKETQEHFGVVVFDSPMTILGTEILCIGGTRAVSVDFSQIPKKIFSKRKYATAACFIAFHNHPSANHAPSADDIELTARLISLGKIMDFDCIDHVVVSQSGMTSIRHEKPAMWE